RLNADRCAFCSGRCNIGLERSIARRCAHLRLGDAAVHWDPRERRELVARSASEARQNNGLWPPSLSNRGPKIKGPKRACATDSRSLSIRTRDNGRTHGPETTTGASPGKAYRCQ